MIRRISVRKGRAIVLVCTLLLTVWGGCSSGRPTDRQFRGAIAEFYLVTIGHVSRGLETVPETGQSVGETFGCLFTILRVGEYDEENRYWPVEATLDLDSEEAQSFAGRFPGNVVMLRATCQMMPAVCSPKAFAVYPDGSGRLAACFESDRRGESF